MIIIQQQESPVPSAATTGGAVTAPPELVFVENLHLEVGACSDYDDDEPTQQTKGMHTSNPVLVSNF